MPCAPEAAAESLGEAISVASADDETIAGLSSLLVETVAGGGSVGFMHPLPSEAARAFWTDSLAAAARGDRVILVARLQGQVAATVTLRLDAPQNQPHRADVAKLMTRPSLRDRGLARALMAEAERIAAARGRWLLTLDTAAEDGAAGFYERQGYECAGVIPDYALKPLGGLTATVIYYKQLPSVR